MIKKLILLLMAGGLVLLPAFGPLKAADESFNFTAPTRIMEICATEVPVVYYENHLQIITCSKGNSGLFFYRFDGNKWNRDQGYNPNSVCPPTLAIVNGKLNLVYKGGAFNLIGHLLISGGKLSIPGQIPQKSYYTPAICAYNPGQGEVLYMAHSGVDAAKQEVWVTHYANGVWAPSEKTPATGNGPVVIAATGNQLHLIACNNYQLYHYYYTPAKGWVANGTIPNAESIFAPCLVKLNNKLYLFYRHGKTAANVLEPIKYTTFNNSTAKWGPPQSLGNFTTTTTPRLVVTPGKTPTWHLFFNKKYEVWHAQSPVASRSNLLLKLPKIKQKL